MHAADRTIPPASPRFIFPALPEGEILDTSTGSQIALQPETLLDLGPVLPSGRVLLRSGSVPPGDSAGPGTLRNWSPAAWAMLDSAVRSLVDSGRASDVLVRTHAADVVSDAPSALRFAASWAEQGVRLVYDPASMFTPATAEGPGAADLFTRRIDALAHRDLARGVAFALVANVRVDGRFVSPSPIDSGLLDPTLVRSAITACNDLRVPVAIFDTDARGESVAPRPPLPPDPTLRAATDARPHPLPRNRP